MKVLIVEDEKNLRKILADFLHREGYICETAADFHEAEAKLADYPYDILLLDLGLPGGSGMDLIPDIKESHPEAGIVIISAKNSLDDKISGLDLGADDYLTKPFPLPELNSRIKALLRRRQFGGMNELSFREIMLNTDSRSVSIHGIVVPFTPKEYDLLLYFMVNINRVLTKETIAEHLWEDNIDLADNFDFIYTHLNNIRRKIKSADGNDYIKTVYGLGYKFTDL